MGLLRGVARTAVVAGTATAVSNRVSRRQARRWGNQEYEQQQTDQPYVQEAGPGEGSEAAQLEKLSQLHDRGILSDEEFAAKKKQVLGI